MTARRYGGVGVRRGSRSGVGGGSPPLSDFFLGSAVAMYDLGVFSSLTFSGGAITNVANLLAPGSRDLDCSATPVQYDASGLDGYPCLTTNGVDEAGNIVMTGSGIDPGDHISAHAVWASIGHDGSSGWMQMGGTGGAYARTSGVDQAIVSQTVGGSFAYATRDEGVPHADDFDLRIVTGMRARRDGGSWTNGTDTVGASANGPITVGRVGGANYELIALAALVICKEPTEAQMDAWLNDWVAARFPTIAGALP